jgi:hypothetical protein
MPNFLLFLLLITGIFFHALFGSTVAAETKSENIIPDRESNLKLWALMCGGSNQFTLTLLLYVVLLFYF